MYVYFVWFVMIVYGGFVVCLNFWCVIFIVYNKFFLCIIYVCVWVDKILFVINMNLYISIYIIL